ncbi:MAG: hypothetical protein JSS72_03940 [Armatimonadetes bacterium]|nr:hypothetical protein [Armatimonadota bacterium]
MFKKFFIGALALASMATSFGQSWTPLNHQPNFSAGVALLLTDGSVLVQNVGNRDWYRLIPDINGSYINGTWKPTTLAPANFGPDYFASAVMDDGRVIAIGGEYNFGSAVWQTTGYVYDPIADTWTFLPAPAGWPYVGDAQCTVLPNGNFLLAQIIDNRIAVLDKHTYTWTNYAPTKNDRNDEEGWTLLPDGSILTCDAIAAPKTERYIPFASAWLQAGNTPQSLADPGSQELGPQVLMTNNKVLAIGATTHNAVYDVASGTWSAAPDFPNGLDEADGPASLLPNGKVFCVASPGVFNSGAHYFEYDPNTNTFTEVVGHPDAPFQSSFFVDMLVLPNGQVLVTEQGSNVQIYTPAGGPQDAWRPTWTNPQNALTAGQTYTFQGTQFNGLSQCNAYGDDYSNASNYPLVRLTNIATGAVKYARTSGHSTMAVATGSQIVSTNVTIPQQIAPGLTSVEIIANGIPSKKTNVIITNLLSKTPKNGT